MKNTSSSYTISFPLAVIMSINAIIGAGLFVNPSSLTLLAGRWSCLSYLLVAFLISPLVLVIAENAALYPATEAGLYTYIEKGVGKKWGLFSMSCYFIAKAISCSILLQTALLYLQKSIPFVENFSFTLLLWLLSGIIGVSNLGGISVGARLQVIFMFLKIIPIALVIVSAYYFFNPFYFSTTSLHPASTLLSSLPIALYALMGFETSCSIGHLIEGGSRAIHRVVLTSFFIVAVLATLFQGALFGTFGPALQTMNTSLSNYFELLFSHSPIAPSLLYALGNICIAFSVIGACYGIMYANSWNGHMIGKHLSSFSIGRFLSQKNRYNIPHNALFLQLMISFFLGAGSISTLLRARLAVIGIATCYLLATVALFNSYDRTKNKPTLPRWITILSFCSCFYIIGTCIKDLLAL